MAMTLICCLLSDMVVYSAESSASQDAVWVLMVGNSLTYGSGNTTIRNLKKMAEKSGRKLAVKQLSYNNEKLSNWADPAHKNGKRFYKEIKRKKWGLHHPAGADRYGG